MTIPGDQTIEIAMELVMERRRQYAKHGDQAALPDGTGPVAARPWLRQRGVWLGYEHLSAAAREATDRASFSKGDGTVTYADILLEEVFEALAESEPARLRAELIQAAAVCVQWAEAIDARGADA